MTNIRMIQLISNLGSSVSGFDLRTMADAPHTTEVPASHGLAPIADRLGPVSLPVLTAGAVDKLPSNGAAVKAALAPSADNKPATMAENPPPTAEELGSLAQASRELESASPEQIIRWAVERFYPKLTMATAFGPEGCVIIYYLSKIQPKVHVFNLDTGYQFKETLELRDKIAEKYGIVVEFKRPATTVEEYEKLHGGPLYEKNSEQCCFDRKVTVLRHASIGWKAWMSGIRRDQTDDRAGSPIVGWDKKFNLAKISPLANWTKKDVWKLIVQENIPYNPLHDQGYPSIGCLPCTRPVGLGEDDRAGRWNGKRKECGLHTPKD